MERTATNSVKYDNRKVIGNQHIFQIRLPKIHSDFESRLFDQLEYCSITWLVYHLLVKKSRFFREFQNFWHFFHDLAVIFPAVGAQTA